jgi:hypothetical protein
MNTIVRTAIVTAALALSALSTPSRAVGAIENPQPSSIQTGITAITGWNCQATQITLRIDGGTPIVAPYGSLRADTGTICGGRITTGFAYLLNYNTLAQGQHTIEALADGVPFASATFSTVNLGAEFLTGAAGEYWVNNFPVYGTRSRLTWQQSTQNFTITATDTSVPPLADIYRGGTLVTNSGCNNPANNGTFFETDFFEVMYGGASVLTMIARASETTSCTYTGTALYSTTGGDILVQNGQFSCTNGTQGTWTADRIHFDELGVLGNLTLKYTVGESCSAAARISGAR